MGVCLSLVLPLYTAACAPRLVADSSGAESDFSTQTTDDDGLLTTVVHAESQADWVFFSLSQAAAISVKTEADAAAWDLGFLRFRIVTNSGVTGAGGVITAPLEGVEFDDISEAPADGYLQDRLDSDDVDNEVDSAFLLDAPWFTYDELDHTLAMTGVVYVLRSVAGRYYKVQMLGYYNEVGSAGFPRFRWEAIAPPPTGLSSAARELLQSETRVIGPTGLLEETRQDRELIVPSDALTIDASSKSEWTFYNLLQEAVVSESADWDISLLRTGLRTNGGQSGSALGGMRLAEEADYAKVEAAPTFAFKLDAVAGVGPEGEPVSLSPISDEWYNYDIGTHIVTAKEQFYYVRSAGGEYFKFEVIDYVGGIWSLRFEEVPRDLAPQAGQLEYDAEPVYFSFETGGVVTPSAPQISLEWDFYFEAGEVHLNSQGRGRGQARWQTQGDAAWGDVTQWLEAATEPETLGSDPRLLVVQTADGGLAKLEIIEVNEGALTFQWAYAGLGRERF